MLQRIQTLMGPCRGQGTSLGPIPNVLSLPAKPSILLDLCVATTWDEVKDGIVFPWRTAEVLSNDTLTTTPSAVDVPADCVGASGKSSINVSSLLNKLPILVFFLWLSGQTLQSQTQPQSSLFG